MTDNSINNIIMAYLDFIQKLNKNPEDDKLQKSLQSLKYYYQLYKSDLTKMDEIKENSQKLSSSSKTYIQFSFSEIEQTCAYLHLMIECCEEKTINIWNKIPSLSQMNVFQEGLSKLWASDNDTVINVNLIKQL